MEEDLRSSEKYQKLTWSKNTYVCPRSNTPSHTISFWARFLDVFKPLLLLTSFIFHCTLLKIVKLWFGKNTLKCINYNLTSQPINQRIPSRQTSPSLQLCFWNCIFTISKIKEIRCQRKIPSHPKEYALRIYLNYKLVYFSLPFIIYSTMESSLQQWTLNKPNCVRMLGKAHWS